VRKEKGALAAPFFSFNAHSNVKQSARENSVLEHGWKKVAGQERRLEEATHIAPEPA